MTQAPFSTSSFSTHELQPLIRLHVRDNLRVNAERWALAHNYHRRRQSIHYQSLWQPGIVYGLGVKRIAAPAESAFQDDRWLEIQPGLAIDCDGNPIVVTQEDDRTYHLALPNLTRPSQTLYLVLSYVDPDGLEIPDSSDLITEQFRFDQYVDQLKPHDIELCRITLLQQDGEIQNATNPLAPGFNQLDLRDRPLAQLRSQKHLSLGYIGDVPNKKLDGLTSLLASLPTLYPQLQVKLEKTALPKLSIEKRNHIDVAYVEAKILLQRNQEDGKEAFRDLQKWVELGGGLIVDAAGIRADEEETLKQSLKVKKISVEHDIGRKPFLFGKWPVLSEYPVELFYNDSRGICLLTGSVTEIWRGYHLPRHDIRTYHEWGINILHHLWERHHMKTLLS